MPVTGSKIACYIWPDHRNADREALVLGAPRASALCQSDRVGNLPRAAVHRT